MMMKREKTMQEAAEELRHALDKFVDEIAKTLKLYALLDWIKELIR